MGTKTNKSRGEAFEFFGVDPFTQARVLTEDEKRAAGWVFNDQPSKTIQSHAMGITPNEIVKRFLATGMLPQSNRLPQYIDASALPTGIDALNLQRDMLIYWQSLPGKVKDIFPNPIDLSNALIDSEQIPKLLELGILHKRDTPPTPGSKEAPFYIVPPEAATPPDKGAGVKP